ncbi:preprotein translocase subunit SecY [Armatimonas sp.]|uniref:preprotein translocase subunit SecY n=1 Tax=Armatimonas sp. TaxID=1872638 RepID=UPI00286C2997|nr:preprotein translocase subunit SecY [Armatimonas sp.]
MLEKLAAAWAVPDIQKRLIFVLKAFLVYVIASHIPMAGINHDAVNKLVSQGLLNAYDVFSGGALKRVSIIGLSLMPYINASIVMQLLTVAIPQLQALSKEGESGRRQISKITRYASIGLGFVQAAGLYNMFASGGAIPKGFFPMLEMMLIMTAGTMFLLWMGEQLTEKGIGNGTSLIIFVGIMISIPNQIIMTFKLVQEGAVSIFGVLGMAILFLASIVGVIYMTQGTRRIPVLNMRKVTTGGKMTASGQSYLPLKVNTAGVIPIIFAMSIQLFPQTFQQFFPRESGPFGEFLYNATMWLNPGSGNIFASLMFAALVMFFTYFYTAVQYDTNDIADNLKKYGSLIPGVKPGKPTAEYLDTVLTRITLAGAVFLATISLMQYWAPILTGTGIKGLSMIGGTSLLIVVGVALETMTAIEAQMAMRNYEGFIKTRPSDSDNMMRGRMR